MNMNMSLLNLLVGCHGSVGVLVRGIATQGFVVIPSAGLLAEATRLSIRVDSSKPFVALARIQLLQKWTAHVQRWKQVKMQKKKIIWINHFISMLGNMSVVLWSTALTRDIWISKKLVTMKSKLTNNSFMEYCGIYYKWLFMLIIIYVKKCMCPFLNYSSIIITFPQQHLFI